MTGKLRVPLAALLLAAIAFAIGLSASPEMHDWLHKTGDWSHHECAATLLSSGGVEHSDCEPPFVAPQPAPATPVFRIPAFAWVISPLEFTRLEHAPPALS
jgi:hypothetical protein